MPSVYSTLHKPGPKKSAGNGRSRPVEGIIRAFLEKHDISDKELEEGELGEKGITNLPSLLRFHLDLLRLNLSWNKIVDVSGLTLTVRLTHLDLSNNNIVDVSRLTLLKGLTYLDLSGNKIEDVSGLILTEVLTYLDLSSNLIWDVSELILLEELFYLVRATIGFRM